MGGLGNKLALNRSNSRFNSEKIDLVSVMKAMEDRMVNNKMSYEEAVCEIVMNSVGRYCNFRWEMVDYLVRNKT
jgi:hypothetical protein